MPNIGPFNIEQQTGSENVQRLRDDTNFEANKKLYPSVEYICPGGAIYLRILRKEIGPEKSASKTYTHSSVQSTTVFISLL